MYKRADCCMCAGFLHHIIQNANTLCSAQIFSIKGTLKAAPTCFYQKLTPVTLHKGHFTVLYQLDLELDNTAGLKGNNRVD